ncbi:MAG: AI-2E family transporter, partial [Candidatus Aminicenantes bacterium]|nr:AI-2E family transporter [Candidatus Aminicenantes bacterium]
MGSLLDDRRKFTRMVLLLSVIFISGLFFLIIRGFLMAILMAGIFSAMARPLYLRFLRWFKGRRSLASFATLLVILLVIIIPLGALLGVVAAQAIEVGNSVSPWIQKQLSDPAGLSGILQKIPFYEQIVPYQGEILQKVGLMVGSLSSFLISGLSAVTILTVSFLFKFFVFLYTMYFFLMDGEKLLEKILYYIPLEEKDERRMLSRFTSVTRATLKGTAVIGVIQGALAGLAFAVVGIPSAVFWGTI